MTAVATAAPQQVQTQMPWDRLAARARHMRRVKLAAIYFFLITVSLPVLLPFFWLVTVAFSSKTGTETAIRNP